MEQLQVRLNPSVQRKWADIEELSRSGNREYAIQVDVKVIPRRAMLKMETKTELEAQVFNKL